MYKCPQCHNAGSRIQVATWKLVQCTNQKCIQARNDYLDTLEYEANEGYKIAKELRYIDEQDSDFKNLIEAVDENESTRKQI